MKTHVEFRTDRFPPREEEAAVLGPERHGQALAEFLAGGLSRHGFEARQPVAEDWGWVVRVDNDAFPLWIGCGSYDEYPDGYLCFIEPHAPTVRRLFRKISTVERVESLRHAVDALLDEAGVSGKQWSTHEEFNGPGAR